MGRMVVGPMDKASVAWNVRPPWRKKWSYEWLVMKQALDMSVQLAQEKGM